MKKLVLFFLFLSPLLVSGQVEDLTKDLPFFTGQMDKYQRWLDRSGLGDLLEVEDIKVEPERLSLYLSFPFEDIDSVMTAWESLKDGFEANSPLTLEQALFYKLIHFMEIRQSMADVQIFDTYNLKNEPLFMRAIYFEDGEVKVEESNPRAEKREVAIRAVSFRDMKEPSVEAVQERYPRDQVFELIYDYAQERFCRRCYEDTNCSGRQPHIRLLEQSTVMRFEVTDLCREVLTDAANPTLCRILDGIGYDCNWVRREKLEFTFTYTPDDEGFLLGVEIDGKYGSGRYDQVPRGGYYSMEVDFDDYLEDYADTLSTTLKRLIIYGRP